MLERYGFRLIDSMDSPMLDEVKQGDLIGVLHPMDALSAGSIEIYAPSTSIVCGMRCGG